MKPEWKDSPEWAKYLTWDKEGWRWWESEPELHERTNRYWANCYWEFTSFKGTVIEERPDGKATTQCTGARQEGV